VQNSPDRGDVQETSDKTSDKTSNINGSEVQDSPDRGDVQETSEEDFENKWE